ncbi:MAG: glycosyltransferase family 1 protein [Parachlamydiaceae bacterium]|nr:glycosyltransferase family 1 protein [Parachlamydiaceae bacterium]
MLKKISLLTNYNLYESKRHFTEKLAEALKRKNIETQIIDAREGALGADVIGAIQRFAPDVTASFNSLDPIAEKKFLWDFLETPHISFLVDPVFYSTFLVESPYSIMTCVDRSDLSAVSSHNFSNAFFWPHAVEKELAAPKNADRPLDVVFLGSCYDYESLRVSWQQRNPAAINKVLDDAIDIVFSDERVSLAQALVQAWNATGNDPQGVDFMTLYYYLDNYTRGKDRVELIRSIKDTQIHVFGELSPDNAVGILGWAPYLAAQKNVTVHPSVPFNEALQIMKKSKIVLNSMPFFRDGTHERIFTALACGCLAITSESIYLREQFREGEGVVFYSSKHRENVSGFIHDIIKQEPKRREAAALGREKVLLHHTWDVRVAELLEKLPPILERINKSII